MANALNAYACYNTDKNIRLSSSSGAVFSSLAEYVIDQQGIVYGVAMSEDCYSAEFIYITRKDDLAKLRGSKYLQAKVGNAYTSAKKNLTSGKLVLFSGTGCQINGLKSFLSKDYSNLICVDIICHGTPSPALWRKYVKWQEQQNAGKLKYINFRCKDRSWMNYGMKEIYESISDKSTKNIYISKDKNAYMYMFLKDYCLRPSCYECSSKKVKMSDLTIADFWGINDVKPEMNDEMGTSLVLIRTAKGKDIFEQVKKNMKVKEVSYEDSVKGNPSEFRSCTRPIQRDMFFDDMYSMNFEELEKKYTISENVELKSMVKQKIKNRIKRICKIKDDEV